MTLDKIATYWSLRVLISKKKDLTNVISKYSVMFIKSSYVQEMRFAIVFENMGLW